jgi:hypothetical protein
MTTPKVRTLWIQDDVWERAQKIAKLHDTSVAKIIDRYLKSLKQTSPIAKSQKQLNKPGNRVRGVRIEDKTWEKTLQLARMNETSATDIIVRYLRNLDDTSKVKRGLTPRRYTADGRRTSSLRKQPIVRPPVDKETCPHSAEPKEVYSRFYCTECGKRFNTLKGFRRESTIRRTKCDTDTSATDEGEMAATTS